MQYSTSGIYGDYARYKRLKEVLLKKESDHLWILGDVVDGNTEHPEDCLKIIKDVYASKNVTLLIGDHEYYHALRIMELIGDRDEETLAGITAAMEQMEIPGVPLASYIESNLPNEELEKYAEIFTSFEVSALVKVGESYLYLCHGAPAQRDPSSGRAGTFEWQSEVVSGEVEFDNMYRRAINADPKIGEWIEQYGPDCIRNPIIICGGKFIAEGMNEGEPVTGGVIFSKRKFAVNEGFSADDKERGPFSILGIDAAGWGVKKIRL